MSDHPHASRVVDRRELLTFLAATGAGAAAVPALGQTPAPRTAVASPQPSGGARHLRKSINLWAFPYPGRWSLKECLQLAKDAGFDAVELNFDLEGEFSAESTPQQLAGIRLLAEQVGIQISGVCSFLFWPFSMTQNDPDRRRMGIRLARQMIEAARVLGVRNVLVVPGAVYIPWLADVEPVPNDVCDERAKAAIRELLPLAAEVGVSLNIENIFANGYLFSPQEIVQFVDGFNSEHIGVHFDTGNIMEYQFPEHWIPILGKRIRNIHFKEWDKRVHEFKLSTFRTLLDGTTNWPAVIEALLQVDYRGYLTFEYFHPFQHYPEALVYQASDALDWMLGRRG